jgi:protocatechuate 3,4-dioxygenase beta subunit
VKVLRILTLLILVSRLLPAQSSAPPAATGTITGHVVLGDSHLPARMAYVILLPAIVADAGDKKQALKLTQTGLDGAFFMPNVLPGSYYIVATKRGYSLPAPDLNGDFSNIDKAPQDVKDALLTIAVVANRTTVADITLNRGAVIAGTVRFDDGEPAAEAKVSFLRKDKSGKWDESRDGADSGMTADDQGNFRIANLSPGEYLLRTTLVLFSPQSPNAPYYSLDIYFDDGMRQRDAKTIKLKDGEESNGNNIEIPLARLHSISGTVLSAENGNPINRASIELHNADDDSTCTVTAINPATGQFHFPYVAEGEYTLKVTNASDIIPGKGDRKPIRTYADASQFLIVKGETSGLTIQVMPKPSAAATSAQ